MKAPTLVDGDLVLWEASAIMAHLCIKVGFGHVAGPQPGRAGRGAAVAFVERLPLVGAVGSFYFEHIVKSTFGMGPPDSESLKAKVPGLMNSQACSTGIWRAATTWRADGSPSRTSSWPRWRPTGANRRCRWRSFPNIVRWLDGLMRIPAWADPWPALTR